MARDDVYELVTASELAGRLRVKPLTILDWYRKGRIPGRKLSHKILRFSVTEVLAALASQAAGSSDETRVTDCEREGVDQ